jgi:hypothetical protein
MINFGIMNFELRLTPWLVSPRATELKTLPQIFQKRKHFSDRSFEISYTAGLLSKPRWDIKISL